MTNRCVHLDRRGKHFNFECSLQKTNIFNLNETQPSQKSLILLKVKLYDFYHFVELSS
jgi:hypothetical protein